MGNLFFHIGSICFYVASYKLYFEYKKMNINLDLNPAFLEQ